MSPSQPDASSSGPSGLGAHPFQGLRYDWSSAFVLPMSADPPPQQVRGSSRPAHVYDSGPLRGPETGRRNRGSSIYDKNTLSAFSRMANPICRTRGAEQSQLYEKAMQTNIGKQRLIISRHFHNTVLCRVAGPSREMACARHESRRM